VVAAGAARTVHELTGTHPAERCSIRENEGAKSLCGFVLPSATALTAVRKLKTLSIVTGFASSLVGTLGAFLFVTSLNDEVQALRAARAAMSAQIEALNNAQMQYFMANQQGDMIFALLHNAAPQRSAIAGLLFAGNVLDRATPIRNVMGALALAGQTDYQRSWSGYTQANEQARASGSLADYQQLKLQERAAVELGSAHVAALHQQIAAIDRKAGAIEASLQRRQTALIALTSFGAAVLLLANLLDERQAARAAASTTPPPTTKESV